MPDHRPQHGQPAIGQQFCPRVAGTAEILPVSRPSHSEQSMDKIVSPGPRPDPEALETPGAEPNSATTAATTIVASERSGEDSDKGHSPEPERVVEWGGPGSRYGKVG